MRGQEEMKKKRFYRRANRVRDAPTRSGHEGRRHLPEDGHFVGNVLHTEEEVRWPRRSELREMKQLRDENTKLKQLVADLALDKHMLQEVIAKKL